MVFPRNPDPLAPVRPCASTFPGITGSKLCLHRFRLSDSEELCLLALAVEAALRASVYKYRLEP